MEIITKALNVSPEANAVMPKLQWLIDLMDSSYQVPLEEKIEIVVSEMN